MSKKGATDLIKEPNYNPGRLIEKMMEMNGTKTDISIAPLFGIDSSGVSRLRSKNRVLSAAMALSVHETTGLSFKEIRELIGVPHAVF